MKMDSPACESVEAATPVESRNRSCFCLSLDHAGLRRGLEADLGARGLSRAMVQTHPHVFASVPMFVFREHIVAPALVPPSERHVAGESGASALKADLRCHAYGDAVTARLYRGRPPTSEPLAAALRRCSPNEQVLCHD